MLCLSNILGPFLIAKLKNEDQVSSRTKQWGFSSFLLTDLNIAVDLNGHRRTCPLMGCFEAEFSWLVPTNVPLLAKSVLYQCFNINTISPLLMWENTIFIFFLVLLLYQAGSCLIWNKIDWTNILYAYDVKYICKILIIATKY